MRGERITAASIVYMALFVRGHAQCYCTSAFILTIDTPYLAYVLHMFVRSTVEHDSLEVQLLGRGDGGVELDYCT